MKINKLQTLMTVSIAWIFVCCLWFLFSFSATKWNFTLNQMIHLICAFAYSKHCNMIAQDERISNIVSHRLFSSFHFLHFFSSYSFFSSSLSYFAAITLTLSVDGNEREMFCVNYCIWSIGSLVLTMWFPTDKLSQKHQTN